MRDILAHWLHSVNWGDHICRRRWLWGYCDHSILITVDCRLFRNIVVKAAQVKPTTLVHNFALSINYPSLFQFLISFVRMSGRIQIYRLGRLKILIIVR